MSQTTNAVDAARAICRVTEDFGEPSAIVAHSFGALAAKLSLDMGLAPKSLVFVAPLPSLAWAATEFARQARVSVPKMLKIAARFARQLGADPSQVALSRPGKGSSSPLLIVHDRNDRRIPFAESEKIAAAWPAATLIGTEGLGHTRILANPEVLESIVDFALAPPFDAIRARPEAG